VGLTEPVFYAACNRISLSPLEQNKAKHTPQKKQPTARETSEYTSKACKQTGLKS